MLVLLDGDETCYDQQVEDQTLYHHGHASRGNDVWSGLYIVTKSCHHLEKLSEKCDLYFEYDKEKQTGTRFQFV